MKASELKDNSNHNYVVIYGGRFQPFHKGHYAIYNRLINEFGKTNVWITMSGKIAKDEGSPFSFDERKMIISNLFDINESNIIKTKSSPIFSIDEVLKHYHKKVTVILITGKKDEDRFKHIAKYDPNKSPIESVYYYPISNHVKLTATEIRNVFSHIKDDAEIKPLMKKYFGKYDYSIGQLIKERCVK